MIDVQRTLRRAALPIFQRINLGDITIRHHWTGDRLRLHSFRHKGYWWYGRKREPRTMDMFSKLISPGDTIFDIGSHIGFVALYLSWLTGDKGRVYCFEPSPLNLPYLDANVAQCKRRNIEVIRAAAGDHAGEVPFFMESLTGQNSTTVAEFRGLEVNSRFNGLQSRYENCSVPMVTADSLSQKPNFVKIDVESGELSVLKGMEHILRTARPRIMVETERDSAALRLLRNAGYVVRAHRELNVFAIPGEDAEGLRLCPD
jgi:FkbM family methyltransferase